MTPMKKQFYMEIKQKHRKKNKRIPTHRRIEIKITIKKRKKNNQICNKITKSC